MRIKRMSKWKLAGDATLTEFAHGDCPEGCFMPEVACNLPAGRSFHFYNVLSIEWKDGIAYRKDIGKVLQEAFDEAGPEEIDVRLG